MDLFRSFFGFPRRNENNLDGHSDDNIWQESQENFGQCYPHEFEGNLPGQDHMISDIDSIFRLFHDIFSRDDFFGGFENPGDFFYPEHDQDVPSIEGPPLKGHLRDKLLKDPDELPNRNPHVERPWSHPSIEGPPQNGHLRDRFLKSYDEIPNRNPHVKRPWFMPQQDETINQRDIDLDEQRKEEHRTVRDNQGNEESTVTKILGDKKYSVTEKKDASGVQETVETFVNVDEGSLPNFQENWDSVQGNHPSNHSDLLVPSNPKTKELDMGFRDLFGLFRNPEQAIDHVTNVDGSLVKLASGRELHRDNVRPTPVSQLYILDNEYGSSEEKVKSSYQFEFRDGETRTIAEHNTLFSNSSSSENVAVNENNVFERRQRKPPNRYGDWIASIITYV
ncbi:hypothetical protein GQR58_014468 [Nymphon striatum]|nr:hypothetical protein GQR58_014468 [Nymphon striatum]